MNNNFLVLLALQTLLHALKVPSNTAQEIVPVVEEVEQLAQHDFQLAGAFKHQGEEYIVNIAKRGSTEDEYLANVKEVFDKGVIGPF